MYRNVIIAWLVMQQLCALSRPTFINYQGFSFHQIHANFAQALNKCLSLNKKLARADNKNMVKKMEQGLRSIRASKLAILKSSLCLLQLLQTSLQIEAHTKSL